MGGNPHVNGGRLLTALDLPDFCDYALDIPGPGQSSPRRRAKLGEFLPRRSPAEPDELPHVLSR